MRIGFSTGALVSAVTLAAAMACGSPSGSSLDLNGDGNGSSTNTATGNGNGSTTGNGTAPGAGTSSGTTTGDGDAAVAPPITDPAKATPFSDDEAFAWLTTECAQCHGVDTNGDPQINASFWAMPPTLTRSWLESSTDTADAYQTLIDRYNAVDGTSLKAMPPLATTYSAAKNADLARAIAWMRATLPLAVFNAESLYEGVTISAATVQSALASLQFSCAETSTLRRFLANFTLAAFDREPTPDELAQFPAAALDQTVTKDQRATVLAMLSSPAGGAEFGQSGLKKLATAIGGAPGIAPQGLITQAIANDLSNEFYQLLLAHNGDWSYPQFFSNDTVYVTANTAPLYGAPCTSPEAGTWAPCTLTAPRHGFFTSLGFLNSKPSSFLATNNNYGRVAFLYFTLYGGMPKAATNGPTGTGTPPPPACLEAIDNRHLVGAAFGTIAVPEVGVLCQGCHIRKGMAAGSVLFRQFSTQGMIYNPTTLAAGMNPASTGDDPSLLPGAFKANWIDSSMTSQTVDATFLTGLLNTAISQPQSCLPTGDPNNPYVMFSRIGDFSDNLAKDTISLATGFTNHANRAFTNASNPTAEMILRVYSVMANPNHTMAQLVAAYFSSDSFACDGGQ